MPEIISGKHKNVDNSAIYVQFIKIKCEITQ